MGCSWIHVLNQTPQINTKARYSSKECQCIPRHFARNRPLIQHSKIQVGKSSSAITINIELPQNGLGWKGPFKDHLVLTPLPWARTPATRLAAQNPTPSGLEKSLKSLNLKFLLPSNILGCLLCVKSHKVLYYCWHYLQKVLATET